MTYQPVKDDPLVGHAAGDLPDRAVRVSALWLVIAGAALTAGPAAARQLVLFPTPAFPLSQSPPLTATISFPNVFRPPVESHERIDVGVDEHGSVVSVEVTQRLVLHQTADYRITIPAPVRDVEPATGTQLSQSRA